MSLKLLDDSVKSYIRTGVAISSISQSVEELVLNSLDAGAQCITVHIHIPNLFIQVTDNGTGISYDDLRYLGQRYATSKCHTLKDLNDLRFHGYRGEALASNISCCGIVELVSRHCLSSCTYCKIFHNGNNLGICPAKHARQPFGIGTTVTLRDIFYNMPVRRKIINSSTESDRIRRILITIALIHPNVSFSLHNDETSEKLLHTRKTNSVLRNFEQLFGTQLSLGLQEVSAMNDSFKISGYVSTKGYYTKSYQFIYINKRHIKHTRLHTHVNYLISNSLITRKISKPGSMKPYSQLEHQQRSVPVESYGLFVLNIECSVNQYDICLEPAKTLVEFKQWSVVLEVVEKAITEFLIRNNLTIGVSSSSLVEETSTNTCTQLPIPCNARITPIHSGVVCYGIQSRPVHRLVHSQETDSFAYTEHTQTTSNSIPLVNSTGDKPSQLNNVYCPRMICDDVPPSKRKKTTNEKDTPRSHDSTNSDSINRVKTIGLTGPMRSPLGAGGRESIAKKLSGRMNSVWQRRSNQCTVMNDSTKQKSNQNQLKKVDQSKITTGNGVNGKTVHRYSVNESSNVLHDIGNTAFINPLSRDCHVTDSNPSSHDNNTSIIKPPLTCTSTKSVTSTDHEVMSLYNTMDSQAVNNSSATNNHTRCDSLSMNGSTSNPYTRCGNTMDSQSINNSTSVPYTRCDTMDDSLSMNSSTTISSNPYTRCGNTMDSQSMNNSTSVDPTDICNTHQVYDIVKPSASLRAAPHLSYGYSSLIPRPKESRKTSFMTDVLPSPSSIRVDLPESKWRDGSEGAASSVISDWINPAFACGGNDILNIGLSSEISSSIKIHSIIHPYKFTNDIFDNIEVLGQIDLKFIACLLKIKAKDLKLHRLLVFFDQHAVHERIRVEALIKDSYKPDNTILSVEVDPPQIISLTKTERRLSLTYKKQLEAIGVSLGEDGNGHIFVHSMPSAFCERDMSERKKGRCTVAMDLVQELVTKQLDLLSSTCGICSVVPSVILQVLNSQACHGAIKFGDSLTNAECSELIHSLSKCNLPFQCAHGRPSLVPILDLDLLERHNPSSSWNRDSTTPTGRVDIGKLKKAV